MAPRGAEDLNGLRLPQNSIIEFWVSKKIKHLFSLASRPEQSYVRKLKL